MQNHFFETKQVMKYATKYIKGSVCDICTDRSKYASIVKQVATSFVYFDIIKNEYTNIVGDPLALPFPNDSFDTVTSAEFIEHIEEPWKFIKQIHRILKIGGICILTVPYIYPRHNRGESLDYFRCSKEGLIYSFKKNGFDIIEADSYNGIWETIFLILRSEFLSGWNGKIKRRVVRVLNAFFRFLDKFNNNKNVYSNIYIIAKKI